MAFLFGNHGKKINIVDAVYPIGSIYLSVNNVNPSNFLGGGWESWGSGRVPVGVNTSDTDFNTVEKTGGAKTHSYTPGGTVGNHTLTVDEIPSHNHVIPKWVAQSGSGNNLQNGTDRVVMAIRSMESDNTGGGGSHNHGFTGTASTQSHVQPYITCYMWKRVS